ncbi:MAG: hypothetical protein ABF709_01495 [Leuconostoc pseudomesenteroides]|uniref:hypothetical protein n=1 Tax=Leuconostoc pseudomesenteroides TaxID=33968 RepID=UPI0039EA6062
MSQIKYENYVVDNLQYSTKKIEKLSISDFNEEEVSFQYSQPTLGLSNDNKNIYFKSNINVKTKILEKPFRSISFELLVFYKMIPSDSDTIDDIVEKFNKEMFMLSLGKVKDIVKDVSQIDYRPPVLMEDISLPVKIKISEKKQGGAE